MATWPGTLPALTFPVELTPSDPRIRSEVASGPAKVRTRFTRPTPVAVPPMPLTKAQHDTLETFFVTTLSEGTATFDHDHPITGTTLSFRFVDRPSYRALDPNPTAANRRWWASFSLEILP